MLERETMVWNKRTAMMMFVRQVTHHLREGTAPHSLHPPPPRLQQT